MLEIYNCDRFASIVACSLTLKCSKSLTLIHSRWSWLISVWRDRYSSYRWLPWQRSACTSTFINLTWNLFGPRILYWMSWCLSIIIPTITNTLSVKICWTILRKEVGLAKRAWYLTIVQNTSNCWSKISNTIHIWNMYGPLKVYIIESGGTMESVALKSSSTLEIDTKYQCMKSFNITFFSKQDLPSGSAWPLTGSWCLAKSNKPCCSDEDDGVCGTICNCPRFVNWC